MANGLIPLVTLIKEWKEIFDNPSIETQKTWSQQLKDSLIKFLFGLVLPQGIDHQTGELVFKMKRSPKGNLQILYLDQQLRITRGNRGTVVICERQ